MGEHTEEATFLRDQSALGSQGLGFIVLVFSSIVRKLQNSVKHMVFVLDLRALWSPVDLQPKSCTLTPHSQNSSALTL